MSGANPGSCAGAKPQALASGKRFGNDQTMVTYRRALVPGGTWFFTLALANRRSTALTDNVELLRESIRHVTRRYPFRVRAIVVLPDHLHTIWTLPQGDHDFSGRWRFLKGLFTRHLKSSGVSMEVNVRGEHGLWQRRYWEHLISSDRDYANHVDYIHANPVRHGYVETPGDWQWSSFHAFVRAGRLPANWMAAEPKTSIAGPVE